VPHPLEPVHLCVLHFTLKIEKACAKCAAKPCTARLPTRVKWRSSAISPSTVNAGPCIDQRLHLADEMKARILNTFLTLMNLRENLDRAALRQPIGRTAVATPSIERPLR